MNPRSIRQYTSLPSLPPRGPLPPMVSVVIPIERTNLITNPSIELATTNYTAVGGSIARSATQQYHGVYSLAVTPGAGTTDGAYFGTVSLTSGQLYAYSCKFKGAAGVPYKLSIATTGAVDLTIVAFVATGRWQWITGYYTETSSTTRRVYFTKNSSTNTAIFYVDGVQVEAINAGESVSTYIDGDQPGLLVGQQPPAYFWTGTPHASTSTRSALTRAGGYLVNLSLYNFLLTGIIGLGMAVPNNVSIPYTVLDGARYLRTTKPPRTISLPGRFQADDWLSYAEGLSAMRGALDRDLTPLQQPLVLVVEPQDGCGTAIGDFAQIQCFYAGGLDGNDGNLPVEDVAPTFTMYLPYIVGGGGGAALTVQQTVTNANYIIQRSPLGVWSALSSGMTGTAVYAILIAQTGTLYAAGDFTDAGGSGADYIAQWSGSAWAVVGSATALSATTQALASDAAGNLYAGGSFVNAGGDANADRIAKWNGAAWSALATGANQSVNALIFDAAGNLYAGGTFTQVSGVANTVKIAKWNGSAWSALSTGMDDTVNAFAVQGTNIYAGGNFATAGGVAAAKIAKWNGSAWSKLTGGVNGNVYAMAFGPDGALYVGGAFTTADGITVNHVARWNGVGWSALGTGVNGNVYALRFDARGNLWAGGAFTAASGITVPDHLAVWNGSAWIYPDVNLPGTATVYAICISNNTIYLGYDQSGSATTAAVTTVTNPTKAYVYPRLVIKGPSSGTSRIFQIINYTTGVGIWLNYTMNAGETAIFTFDPTNPTFVSDFQGDLTSTILPGSQPSQFYLAPGANSISFYAAASTVTATLSWPNRYNGLSDLVN